MKTLWHILGFLILVSFLFTNNGLTTYKNTCPMSGQVTYEYFFNTCCCSGESGSGCCETTVNHIQFVPDGYFSADNVDLTLSYTQDIIPIVENLFKSEIVFYDEREKDKDYPPPNFSHGRQLLVELETFLI